jgi:phage baseplate assembly protein gpV
VTSLIDTIQAIVRTELQAVRTSELAIVKDVHPHRAEDDADNYGCDVELKNSGLPLFGVPVATGHIGTAAIPNVGDLVLVTFDHGDVNQPIIVGRLYNDVDRPPLSTTDEIVVRLPLAAADDRSVLAAVRNHQDRSPPRELLVELPPSMSLRITDATVAVIAGSTELTLDQPGGGGGTVTVVAGRTTLRMDQDGDVTVDSLGSLAFTASADLSLEAGRDVRIRAGGQAQLEAGTTAEIAGGLEAVLRGGAAATIQGATVSVKGFTSFSP